MDRRGFLVASAAAMVGVACGPSEATGVRVVRGVVVVRFQSVHTGRLLGFDERTYGAAVDRCCRYGLRDLVRAIPLYENTGVYSSLDGTNPIWHIRNCAILDAGLCGDFHYLASHPMARRLARATASDLRLSHHVAFGGAQLVNGTIELGEITEVFRIVLLNPPCGFTVDVEHDVVRFSEPFQWPTNS